MKKFLLLILFLLIGLVVGLLVASRIAGSSFHSKFQRETSLAFQQSPLAEKAPITEADIAHLPLALQKHLRYAGVLGKPPVQFVRLRQKGGIKQAPDQGWLKMEAEQYYTVDPMFFNWHARVQAMPLVPLYGRDIYYQGHGHMLIKLGGLLTVVNEKGPALDQGELLRYFSEMIFFPSALLHPAITWKEIDAQSVQGTIRDGQLEVSATFFFDEEGRFQNLEAMRMYNDGSGQEPVLRKWYTPMSEYGEFDGYKIPIKGNACWDMDGEPFCYIQLEVSEVTYNDPRLFDK